MRFLADVLKKTSTSMFLTMFEKTKTSYSRCILAMFFERLKKYEKMYEIFRYFFNRLKNIANMHREHDVLGFFKHRQKHRGRCFFLNIG